MAKFEITAPDGARFEITAPDNATQEQVMAYAQSQYKPEKKEFGKNMADLIPGQRSAAPVGPQRAPVETPQSKLLNVFAPAENALTLATGIGGGLLAPFIATGARMLGHDFTPKDDPRRHADIAEVSRMLTYQPRSPAAQEDLRRFASIMTDGPKLAGIGPTEGMMLSALMPPAITQTTNKLASMRGPAMLHPAPEPQMVGMGAATTAIPQMRTERAAQLPVPIQLTKGQATRDFGQLQFERETAKSPVFGAPIRERMANQNQQILQNFDAWIDETGAQSPSLRSVGETVTNAIVAKANKAKADITKAYEIARAKGEMQEPISVAPLAAYLEHTTPESINAPVLASAKAKLDQLAVKGIISINDVEEIRKMVGRLGREGPNAYYAGEIKRLIDTMTEGKGGDAYKIARTLRTKYGEEFSDIQIVDRLMSTRPGTKDRLIAYEDVFQKSVMGGSLDDVKALRKTLQSAGPKGQQAWKELQGQTVKNIKDEITKNVTTNERGQPIVSAARLNQLVNELDKDGKLDFIFGKQGAQKIRDVNEIAKDVLTAPPGSVNTSNTATVLLAMLDTAISAPLGLPLPITTSANFALRKMREGALTKRVTESLNYPNLPAKP